jgi:hypothetical protein
MKALQIEYFTFKRREDHMLLSNHLQKYKTAILSLPTDRSLTKDDLQVDDFLMARFGQVEIYYAPHNEYVNLSAKVMIIGITPGWVQMKTAYREARKGLEQGLRDEEICKRAKEEAGFAGSMRVNLISMLDALDLHRYLNIPSCEDLFLKHRNLLHTTSLLRFPVFIEKRNYTGANPTLFSAPFLRESALLSIQEEIQLLQRALIIPLGKTVERGLHLLERICRVDVRQCLWGFPHPSGANGHRHVQFTSNLSQMKHRIKAIVPNL